MGEARIGGPVPAGLFITRNVSGMASLSGGMLTLRLRGETAKNAEGGEMFWEVCKYILAFVLFVYVNGIFGVAAYRATVPSCYMYNIRPFYWPFDFVVILFCLRKYELSYFGYLAACTFAANASFAAAVVAGILIVVFRLCWWSFFINGAFWMMVYMFIPHSMKRVLHGEDIYPRGGKFN